MRFCPRNCEHWCSSCRLILLGMDLPWLAAWEFEDTQPPLYPDTANAPPQYLVSFFDAILSSFLANACVDSTLSQQPVDPFPPSITATHMQDGNGMFAAKLIR